MLLSAALLLGALVPATPAFAVNKEMVQLQTQVQALQDQMARMQQSFDERMGVMRNLIEQSTDNMNKVSSSVDNLQKALQQQSADGAARIDQVSGQVQSMHDSIDELKAKLNQIATQLQAMQQQQQTLPAPNTAPQAQAPPPDVLYNNALRDYNAGKYDLASQEFADYLKYYPTTDLAGNAQFYIAEIEYKQGNDQQAVRDYQKVLDQFPGGNKAAAAQLKKGFALLDLGDREAGMRELNAVVARYPRSPEAAQARDRLHKLTATKRTPR